MTALQDERATNPALSCVPAALPGLKALPVEEGLKATAMKILFVNRFFFPDHSATSQMLSDLAFHLAKAGHEIEIITSSRTYDGTEKLKARETVGGVKVVRLPVTGFGRAKLLGRSLDYLSFYLAAFFSLLWRVRTGDIVVAKTDPPMLSVLTAPLCALKGACQINWLQDLFPEVAAALGEGPSALQKAAMALLRAARNASLKSARLNIVIGEAMAARLKSLGVSESRIGIIQNWADGALIRPIAPQNNPLRKAWGLEEAFVIGYSGNLGRAHDIGTFLAAIEALEDYALAPDQPATPAAKPGPAFSADARLPQARLCFLFTGGGVQMEALKREVMRRKFKSVLFRPYQPRALLSESLSLPDVHLISLKPGLEGLIVPSKYYGIAAAGRPAIFVGHEAGEIAKMLCGSATGFAVREGDGEGLARAILALAEDKDLAALQGRGARQLFEAELDFPIAAAAWQKALIEAGCTTKAGVAKAGRARFSRKLSAPKKTV
ncbi:MAG: glycosyltransferase family 4 protein [Rhodomicrobium sp.]